MSEKFSSDVEIQKSIPGAPTPGRVCLLVAVHVRLPRGFRRRLGDRQDGHEVVLLLVVVAAIVVDGDPGAFDLARPSVPATKRSRFYSIYFSQVYTMTMRIKLWQQHCNV
jgi:hypothetical protein